MVLTTCMYGAMFRRALKSRRTPATRSTTIEPLLPDRQRSRSTWRRRLLRVCKLVVPAIAALLWSAAAGYGQAPAASGAAPKPGGSVEQRWPAYEAAEPAPPKSDQDIQPVRRETTPAPTQDQKVQPEIRKAQPVEPQAASRGKGRHAQAESRGRKDRNEAKENPARQSPVSAKQRFRAATQRAGTVWIPVRRSAARI
jgi:hypothetical protein